jgi:hypothetical protein
MASRKVNVPETAVVVVLTRLQASALKEWIAAHPTARSGAVKAAVYKLEGALDLTEAVYGHEK